MKKLRYSINSDFLAYIKVYLKSLLPHADIVDLFMENKYVCVILDNGLKVKVKQ